jgi:ATP-binding cassette subfamily B protein
MGFILLLFSRIRSMVFKGKILLDGVDVQNISLSDWRSHIGYVAQDVFLLNGTLAENIRFYNPDITDAEVMEALTKADLDEFVQAQPKGMHTLVGERGVLLSGGQRQRVAIARALARRPEILILDEATSSLDSESESMIQDALNNLMKKKTVIVVAHRLSTIMKMDRIIVVDRGQILENGTHVQLLKKKTGMYKNLWNLQAGGFIA